MNTADAFRIIGRSILRHIAGNETAVRRSDSEGVHQMRVGLRRLRAAISLFAKLAWRPGDRAGQGRAEMADRRTSARPRPRCLHEKRDRTVTSRRADEAWNEGTNRHPDIATRRSLRQGKGRGQVRRAIVRFYSTRCNGWKMEIGPSISGFMDIDPLNGSPRIFSRGVLVLLCQNF